MVQSQDLRLVTSYWVEGGKAATHIVSAKDLDKYVEAVKKLHHSPGYNPHSRLKAIPVRQITVRHLVQEGPYWWSTPDLQNNDDPNGAKIWYFTSEETVWDLQEQEAVTA